MARVVRVGRRGYWAAAVLAVAAAATGNWWLNRAVQPDAAPAIRVDQRIDYALENYRAAFFDRDGRLTLRLAGPRLEHEAATRDARLVEPRFEIEPATQGWSGRSERGLVDRDARVLTLEGSVRMQRPHPRGEVVVESELLEYDDQASTVHSPGAARIEQAGNVLTGGTLTVWIDDERMELNRDAQAIYRAAGPADRR